MEPGTTWSDAPAEVPSHGSVLDAFQGSIRRPKLSIAYRIGLGLVAVAMVVLPMLYVLLILLSGYGVYFYATHYFAGIWEWPIGNSLYGQLIKVLCSCTPLLAGGMVVVFMVKPLFARRAPRMQPYALNPADEPLVYSFIQRICEMVGAPAPKSIRLDCDLNASASFRRGMFSFLGDDLVLTLGMPMVAGLNTREFAGVIAHEFAHFTQGTGMRLSYVIRGVNFWFARVVYERDAWDATLKGLSQSRNLWLRVALGCAWLGVCASRQALRLLMLTGHALSGFLLRQMEYDADRYAIELAGSEAVESTTGKFALLEYVLRDIHLSMRRMWRSSFRLPDNLPLFVEARSAALSPEKAAKILEVRCAQKAGLFSTHPAPMERVARARQINAAGVFGLQEPARDLFQNFENLSRFVTLAHYEDDLQVPTKPDFLIPVDVLLAQQAAATEPSTDAWS